MKDLEPAKIIASGNVNLRSLTITGPVGPNDYGYIHAMVVNCAKELRRAQEIYSQGHYPHSNARIIPTDHPLRLAMVQLARLDKEFAKYTNQQPDKTLFSTYKPPVEDLRRWESIGKEGKE